MNELTSKFKTFSSATYDAHKKHLAILYSRGDDYKTRDEKC